MNRFKIKDVIKYYIPCLYNLDDIYMMAPSILRICNNQKIDALEFIYLGDELALNEELTKYKIKNVKIDNCYNICSNGMNIKINICKELFDVIEYNVDGLFYDINRNKFLPITAYDAIENGIRRINSLGLGITESRQKYVQLLKKVF